MPIPKFNFVPERQLGETAQGGGVWRVSLLASKATATLYFPTEMVRVLDMDGAYYRFFADVEKKTIGWKRVEGKVAGMDEINDARLLKKNPSTGAILLGIGRILKSMGYKVEKTVAGLEVKTYTSALIEGEIHYVILPELEKQYTPKKEADGH